MILYTICEKKQLFQNEPRCRANVEPTYFGRMVLNRTSNDRAT